MKKIIFIVVIFALIILFNINVLAKTGDVIGNIYSTDILAYINDVPVQSYAIDGKTAIILEDLEGYGIYCQYDNKTRTLTAATGYYSNSSLIKQVSRGKVGKITGKIYETNIKVFVNGVQIKAFELNGKTAVAIEDLGRKASDSAWSQYGMRCVWNAKDRTIKSYYIYDNSYEIRKLIDGKPIEIMIENDSISFVVNHFPYLRYEGTFHSADFNPSNYYPMYCGDQKVGIGFYRSPGEQKYTWRHYYDLDALKKIIDEIITEPTYEKTLNDWLLYFSILGHINDRIDTDSCTFIYGTIVTPHGGDDLLIRIDKNGGYIDYAKEFESVSITGLISFYNIVIDAEKEIVKIRYKSVDYIIDLKTGIMTKQ